VGISPRPGETWLQIGRNFADVVLFSAILVAAAWPESDG